MITSDNQAYSVGTLVPVFPVTKAAGATIVKGKAYAELDATNDMIEKAEGAMVQATISVNNALSPYTLLLMATTVVLKMLPTKALSKRLR